MGSNPTLSAKKPGYPRTSMAVCCSAPNAAVWLDVERRPALYARISNIFLIGYRYAALGIAVGWFVAPMGTLVDMLDLDVFQPQLGIDLVFHDRSSLANYAEVGDPVPPLTHSKPRLANSG